MHPRTAVANAPVPTAGHCQSIASQEILKHRQVQLSLLWVTSPFPWLLVPKKFCLFPPKVYFPQFCGYFVIKYQCPSKSDSLGIPDELSKILKDYAFKVVYSICQQIWKNSAMVTGLEKVSFHANPKERQWQRMFKVLYNCVHFTCQQGNAQNPSSQASTVCELRASRCTSWIQKRQRNQKSYC